MTPPKKAKPTSKKDVGPSKSKKSSKEKSISVDVDKASLKKSKFKSVVAEIVDTPSPKMRDLNRDESQDLNEESSPLEIAAQKAEEAYQSDSDDFDSADDLAPELSASKSVVVSDGTSVGSTDPLMIYLSEIRKYPLLTRDQEKEISKKFFETKDPEAGQILVRSNLRFVVKIAAEYSKFGAKLIDLIQEGNVGLIHAVREYNPYKGARLITYAVWWIRGYIQEYLMRQYSMVRIGTTQNQRKLFYQLQREKANLDSMGNEKNLADLAKRLDIPEDEVITMAQRMSGRDVSLDRPLDDEGGPSLSDFQKSTTEENIDDTLAREELIHILQDKVSELEPELSEREKILLKERLLNDEPLTLQEIGEKYGITREAVRQMEVRLLKKIKDKMGDV